MKEDYVVGYADKEYGVYIKNTPENISNFIMKHGYSSNVIITDMLDRLILNTFGIYINQCPDQRFLIDKMHPALIPLQLGEKETSEVIYHPDEEQSNDIQPKMI